MAPPCASGVRCRRPRLTGSSLQLLSPAIAESAYVDRKIQRDGRPVRVRETSVATARYSCCGTVLAATPPFGTPWFRTRRCFLVVAEDLPGHGQLAPRSSTGSPTQSTTRMRCSPTSASASRSWLVTRWAAGRLSTTRRPSRVPPWCAWTGRPGWTMRGWAGKRIILLSYLDPPDVVVDLDAVRCPAMVVFCRAGLPGRSGSGWCPSCLGLSEYLLRRRVQRAREQAFVDMWNQMGGQAPL